MRPGLGDLLVHARHVSSSARLSEKAHRLPLVRPVASAGRAGEAAVRQQLSLLAQNSSMACSITACPLRLRGLPMRGSRGLLTRGLNPAVQPLPVLALF